MVDQVKTQVDQALGRLEAAVEAIGQRAAEREAELLRRLEASRQETVAAQQETAAARQETATARQEIAVLKQDNTALQQLLDETSLRLDQAIERLQGLLAKALAD